MDVINLKTCCTCKKEFTLENFCKSKNTKDGLNKRCRSCTRECYYKYYDDNIDTRKRWQENNPKYSTKYFRDVYIPRKGKENAAYKKAWTEKNREKLNKRRQELRNTPEGKAKRAAYHKLKSETDPSYVIGRRLRGRLYTALRGIKKENTINNIENLIGCSLLFFMDYIAMLFTKEMTWDMLMKGKIHIDHYKPCTIFDLTKEEEQKKCFHYSNLRPLLASENCSKAYEDKKMKKLGIFNLAFC